MRALALAALVVFAGGAAEAQTRKSGIAACCWTNYCKPDGEQTTCNQCVGVDENGGCPEPMITATCPNSSGDGCTANARTVKPGFILRTRPSAPADLKSR